MSETTRSLFDAGAADYDQARRRLLPDIDGFYGGLLDRLPEGDGEGLAITDLGAGTGLLSAFVRKRLPKARLTLLDLSEEMLARARERFAGDPLVEIRQADLAADALPAHQDAFVSAVAIHHLDDAGKRALFAKILAALKPGGQFLNAEQVAGPSETLDKAYHDIWLREVAELGASEPEIEAALMRMSDDRCAPLAPQLDWLTQAGFADADCWYKRVRFAVYGAVKP